MKAWYNSIQVEQVSTYEAEFGRSREHSTRYGTFQKVIFKANQAAMGSHLACKSVSIRQKGRSISGEAEAIVSVSTAFEKPIPLGLPRPSTPRIIDGFVLPHVSDI